MFLKLPTFQGLSKLTIPGLLIKMKQSKTQNIINNTLSVKKKSKSWAISNLKCFLVQILKRLQPEANV